MKNYKELASLSLSLCIHVYYLCVYICILLLLRNQFIILKIMPSVLLWIRIFHKIMPRYLSPGELKNDISLKGSFVIIHFLPLFFNFIQFLFFYVDYKWVLFIFAEFYGISTSIILKFYFCLFVYLNKKYWNFTHEVFFLF